MAEPSPTNALRRKANVGQRVREVEGLSPTRALRLSLARAAGDLWELPLSVTGIRHEIAELDKLSAALPSDNMIVLLDGPDGRRGGLCVDRALLTSVIEVQILGEVTERPPTERDLTATDAALFAPLVDTALERLDIELNGARNSLSEGAGQRLEAAWALGYRFGALVETPRALQLSMACEGLHMLTLSLDIAAGLRQGQMILCLPELPQDTADVPTGDEDEAGRFAASLSMVDAELEAVLPRVRLPLSKATALKVGDLIDLPQETLYAVALRGPDEKTIARCRLGQVAGKRAVRLQVKSSGATLPHKPQETQSADARFVPTTFGAETDGPPDRDGAGPTEEPVEAPASAAPELPEIHADQDDDDDLLPDLPPLDFDGDLPALGTDDDIGNANFE